jgi:hypothetical protein
MPRRDAEDMHQKSVRSELFFNKEPISIVVMASSVVAIGSVLERMMNG